MLCDCVLLCCTHPLLCPLCCALGLLCCVGLVLHWRRRRLVKVMHGRPRVRMGRLTNAYQPWRPNQKPCGLACGTPYQSLPRSVLAMRFSLVHLAWCRNPYQVLPTDRSGCAPPSIDHYQPLPSGLVSGVIGVGITVTVDIVDIVGGGPEGRCVGVR